MTPTRTRYWVIFSAVTLAILSYIDRVAISQASTRISNDLHLTESRMGMIFGAFALSYALFEVPSGWLGDWIGPRRVLVRIVLWWSAFTALTAGAWSFRSLYAIRFLFGAGEAGCFPNLTKAFRAWLPLRERSFAQGVMWSFARWGGAFTPPLVLFTYRYIGWRWAFVVFGSLGPLWAFFFNRWFRDRPDDHPSVNAAERELLSNVSGLASGHGDVPWKKLISRRSVWLLWAQYFCMSFPWYFYIPLLPRYLEKGRHLPENEVARLAILPLLFGGFGSLACGWLAPRLARAMDSVSLSRRVIAVAGMLGACACLLVSMRTENAFVAMLWMGLASFANDLNMPPAWNSCMDIGGKNSGTVAGSMKMMGNLARFAPPRIGGNLCG